MGRAIKTTPSLATPLVIKFCTFTYNKMNILLFLIIGESYFPSCFVNRVIPKVRSA